MADEKYRLTLEGSEIDEALLRLANYEDEGLVLGSRKGVMLGPGSEYYHKNARYYAELAQSAVPGDTTSAVRWDIDQSALTDADREMARKNIRAGGSNRNLLDNPWWGSGEAVNQRNTQSKPSNGSYTIDRWILTSGADANQWAIGANGITFTIASSSIWYTQRTPNPSAWSGKTLTASVLLSDGTIKSGSAAFTYGSAATFYNDSALNLSMNTSGQFVLAIRSTQTIRAVKLEIGSVSTLANDAPPDYETELWKCQHYFVRLRYLAYFIVGIGYAPSSTYFKIDIPVPASLRDAVLQFSYTGSPTINGNAITGGYEIYRTTTGHIQLHLATNGLTAGNVYGLYTGPSEFIMNISADL